MIQEIYKPEVSKYGRFFLFSEADDEQPEPKRNTKVINVKPNNRSKIDFTDGSEQPEPEEPSEETPVDTPDIDTGANEDFTTDTPAPDAGNEAQPDAPPDPNIPEPDPGTGPDVGGDVDFTADGGEATGGEDAGAEVAGDEPDTGGDEDFTADADGGEGENPEAGGEADPNADPNAGGDKKGPGIEYDSTRKYNLFENYVSLSNAIDNYISKLENQLGDDFNINRVYRITTDKLREIRELCTDYMMMKFELSTYVQSLLFFQELVIMVQMAFDFLEKSRKMLQKPDKVMKH